MTVLYTNGCSFTANSNLPEHERWPYLVAKAMGWKLIDKSTPGACNARILRCSMRDCEKISRDDDIVALIQLTFTERFEIPLSRNLTDAWNYDYDPWLSIKTAQDNHLWDEIRPWVKQTVIMQDRQAQQRKLYCDILGLLSFFKIKNIDYKIFAGPNLDLADVEDPCFQALEKDPNVLDLRAWNMLELTGKIGHPDATGMRQISDYFTRLVCGPK